MAEIQALQQTRILQPPTDPDHTVRKSDITALTQAQGWLPVLEAILDDGRCLIRLQNWIGGSGTTPTDHLGEYLTTGGLTANAADATDFRGDTGVAGINYRGDYAAADTYNTRDVVRAADGNAYFCNIDNMTGVEPPAAGWAIFVMKGAPGDIPTIGANGNWFYGATDSGISSKGAKGDKGDTGSPGAVTVGGLVQVDEVVAAAGKKTYTIGRDPDHKRLSLEVLKKGVTVSSGAELPVTLKGSRDACRILGFNIDPATPGLGSVTVSDTLDRGTIMLINPGTALPLKDSTGTTWTHSGGSIVTAGSKFGASLYLNTNVARAQRNYNAKLNLLNKDFTFDAWVKTTSTAATSASCLFNQSNGSAGSNSAYYWGVAKYQGFWMSDLTGWDYSTGDGTRVINNGVWHHVAVTRSGNTIRCFVDGQLDDTATLPAGWSFGNSTRVYELGAQAGGSGYIGYAESMRHFVGRALWTANFTPPQFKVGTADGMCLAQVNGDTSALYYWNGSAWAALLGNETTVSFADWLSKGMDIAKFNIITGEQWRQLTQTQSINIFMLDEFVGSIDKKVETKIDNVWWKKAAHPTDYDYMYPDDSTLEVEYKTTGTYKVNTF